MQQDTSEELSRFLHDKTPDSSRLSPTAADATEPTITEPILTEPTLTEPTLTEIASVHNKTDKKGGTSSETSETLEPTETSKRKTQSKNYFKSDTTPVVSSEKTHSEIKSIKT
ncbi:hypothetical protein TWF281_007836 [Arthrobotrys megalospora]